MVCGAVRGGEIYTWIGKVRSKRSRGQLRPCPTGLPSVKEIEEDEEMKQASLPVLEKVNIISSIIPNTPIKTNTHTYGSTIPPSSFSPHVFRIPAGVSGCWREGVGMSLPLPPHPGPLLPPTANSAPNAAATATSTAGHRVGSQGDCHSVAQVSGLLRSVGSQGDCKRVAQVQVEETDINAVYY